MRQMWRLPPAACHHRHLPCRSPRCPLLPGPCRPHQAPCRLLPGPCRRRRRQVSACCAAPCFGALAGLLELRAAGCCGCSQAQAPPRLPAGLPPLKLPPPPGSTSSPIKAVHATAGHPPGLPPPAEIKAHAGGLSLPPPPAEPAAAEPAVAEAAAAAAAGAGEPAAGGPPTSRPPSALTSPQQQPWERQASASRIPHPTWAPPPGRLPDASTSSLPPMSALGAPGMEAPPRASLDQQARLPPPPMMGPRLGTPNPSATLLPPLPSFGAAPAAGAGEALPAGDGTGGEALASQLGRPGSFGGRSASSEAAPPAAHLGRPTSFGSGASREAPPLGPALGHPASFSSSAGAESLLPRPPLGRPASFGSGPSRVAFVPQQAAAVPGFEPQQPSSARSAAAAPTPFQQPAGPGPYGAAEPPQLSSSLPPRGPSHGFHSSGSLASGVCRGGEACACGAAAFRGPGLLQRQQTMLLVCPLPLRWPACRHRLLLHSAHPPPRLPFVPQMPASRPWRQQGPAAPSLPARQPSCPPPPRQRCPQAARLRRPGRRPPPASAMPTAWRSRAGPPCSSQP